MTARLGFAIVGCGAIARTHVRALADIPDAKLAALVGRSLDAPRRLAQEANLPDVGVYDRLDDALSRPDVDAVIICTPSGDHLDPAVAAARAGKHVIVEKPLEITPERCDQIISACDQASVQLATVFPRRFADCFITMKQAVTQGRFGRLVLGAAECLWWRDQAYYDSGDWRGTWKLDGGGALMNQAIHMVDVLLWLMGPAAHVTATAATLAHERIEIEDTAAATVKFANGAIGSIVATTGAYPGKAPCISISGDRGTAAIVGDGITYWEFAEPQPEDKAIQSWQRELAEMSGAADPKAISHVNHARQLADFVEAIRHGRKPQVDGREGRKAVVLICAVYQASRTGRGVELRAS